MAGSNMNEMIFRVPTYYGEAHRNEPPDEQRPDFAAPFAPVLAYRDAGVRILLGAVHRLDVDAPDIQIERRPHGWAIFLHPFGAGDPSGYIYFLDDGRSFLIPENGLGSTRAIEVLGPNEKIPELDAPVSE